VFNGQILPEDIDHGSLDVRGVISLANDGIIFNVSDIDILSNTLIQIIGNNFSTISGDIAGGRKSPNNLSAIMLWSILSEYNDDVLKLYRRLITDLPPVYDYHNLTARYEIVGVSHLIKSNRINVNTNVIWN